MSHFLPNPVDLKNIKSLARNDLGDWRDQLLSSSYILNVGSLTKQKNHRLLVSIYSVIRTRWPDLKLVLIGEGEEEAGIRSVCSNFRLSVHDSSDRCYDPDANVYLLGFQNNPYPFIKHCKAFVMTSRWEGLPDTEGLLRRADLHPYRYDHYLLSGGHVHILEAGI